jgi:hypothetical protein
MAAFKGQNLPPGSTMWWTGGVSGPPLSGGRAVHHSPLALNYAGFDHQLSIRRVVRWRHHDVCERRYLSQR